MLGNGNAHAAPAGSFQHFKSDILPPETWKKFNLHRHLIFHLMEACPGLDVNGDCTKSFNLAVGYFKER
jgi:hypothetical protein